MRISEETIKHFANRGVSVRWYAEHTFEEYKQRVWNTSVQRYVEYYKDCVGDGCAANKLYETFDELEAAAKVNADIECRYLRGAGYDDTTLFIEYDGKLIIKKENVKSKEITIEMIDKLIAKNEKAYSGYYGEFAKNMQRLLNENGLTDKFSVYPTTYGIGIWVIYNWNAKEEIEKVTKILDERGIEYYNEYSEAGWVYRYKVSKRADNIAKAV